MSLSQRQGEIIQALRETWRTATAELETHGSMRAFTTPSGTIQSRQSSELGVENSIVAIENVVSKLKARQETAKTARMDYDWSLCRS